MKVSILTEGLASTGYGHIIRCISIYNAFVERNIRPTLYINGDDNSIGLLEGTNYYLIDWQSKHKEIEQYIDRTDILVIDSYLASSSHFSHFSSFATEKVFLDDNMRIDYPSGIVVNGTIKSETFPYVCKTDQKYLLGTKHILLRKEFQGIPSRIIKQKLGSVLITFGGQDTLNLTIPILELVNNNFPELKVSVIIGSGFEKQERFTNHKNDSNSFYYSPCTSTIRDLMLESDLCISAAGQTLYELAACGTPTIAVAVVDNQKTNMLEWVRATFIHEPIFCNENNMLEKIQSSIQVMKSVSVRKKASGIGQKYVDGLGAKRLVEMLCKNDKEAHLTIRQANEDDILHLFELANDPVVRSNSINTNSITWDDHVGWFRRKSTDTNCFLFVFHQLGDFVGQVRFDLIQAEAIISISVAEKFRGRGLAKQIILKSVEKYLLIHPDTKTIVAYIRPENKSSIKSFLSAAFTFKEDFLINEEKYLKYISV